MIRTLEIFGLVKVKLWILVRYICKFAFKLALLEHTQKDYGLYIYGFHYRRSFLKLSSLWEKKQLQVLS